MNGSQHRKDTVSFTGKDRIAWVKYNCPDKRNAQSPELNRRVYEVIDELKFRDIVCGHRFPQGLAVSCSLK